MYLYKQYCYESINDVLDSINSDYFIGSGSFISNSVLAADGVSIDITINSSGVLSTSVFRPPVCSVLGFDNSFTGVDTFDAVEMSWLVVASFAAAYSIKILRRTF